MVTPPLTRCSRTAAAGALLFALATLPASASLVLLDNSSQGSAAFGTSVEDIDGARRKAAVFSTTANLNLTSVTLALISVPGGAGDLDIGLYSVNGSNNPTGTALASVTTPLNSFNFAAYYTFALSGLSVTAGNSYALVVSGFDIPSQFFSGWVTPASGAAPTGSNGISYIANRSSTDSGATWSPSERYGAIYLQGEAAVPEPASLALVGTGLAGLAARRRRRRGNVNGARG